ncbi:tail fiber domain-containing protein, partial [Candidatus Peregrinibacteria bacterium]|nr:tail fiber domain-containing protein [Candidatus Peregrinibacteria bacterium]
LEVVGTMSGSALTLLNPGGLSYALGNLSLGATTSKGRLTVYGSGAFTKNLSGNTLTFQSGGYVLGNLGIGRNTARTALEVQGTISGSALNVTSLNVTGLTQGSVLFAGSNGALSQSNAQFFWNNTTSQLGIGTASPKAKFVVVGSGAFTESMSGNTLLVQSGGYVRGRLAIGKTGALTALDVSGAISGALLTINAGSNGANYILGNLGVGTVNNVARLNVAGTMSGRSLHISGTGASTSPLLTTNLSRGMIVMGSGSINGDYGGTGSLAAQLYVTGRMPISFTGSGKTGTAPRDNGIAIQGRYLYLTEVSFKLETFDISNPSKSVSVSTLTLGSNIIHSVVQGRYVYSWSNTVFYVNDMSNPASPQNIGSTTGTSCAGNGAWNMTVQGRYVYAACSGILKIVDVTNPTSPAVIASLAWSNAGTHYITVQGRYLYSVVYTGTTYRMEIIDIANPAAPKSLSNTSVGTNPSSIFIQGRYAYIGLRGESAMQIFDIKNPVSPVFTGTGVTSATPYSVYVQGRVAYVTNSGSVNNLQALDVSNPHNPVSLGTVTTAAQPNAIVVQGRYAYVTSNLASNLSVYDIGGSYIQNVEAGSVEAAGVSIRNLLQAGDADIRGGLGVGRGLAVNGGATINTTSTGSAVYGLTVLSSLEVVGTMSGSALTLLNPGGLSYALGNLSLGATTSKGRLTVYGSGAFTGTLSGAGLFIQGTMTGSSLVIKKTTTGSTAFIINVPNLRGIGADMQEWNSGSTILARVNQRGEFSKIFTGKSTGSFNEMFGSGAGMSLTTSINDTFMGWGAGLKATASNNTFVGYYAGAAETSQNNVFVGTSAGSVATGAANSGIGSSVLSSLTSGTADTAVGSSAGSTITTGSFNSFLGRLADATVATLNNVTVIGYKAKAAQGNIVVLGSGANVLIHGEIAGTVGTAKAALAVYGSGAFTKSMSGNTILVQSGGYVQGRLAIGKTTGLSALDVVGRMSGSQLTLSGLASEATTQNALCVTATGTVLVNSAATCTVSSVRFKHDIQTIQTALQEIRQMRPVQYRDNGNDVVNVGLIAEDVQAIDPRIVFYENDGTTPRGVKYENLTAILLRGLQETDARVGALESGALLKGRDLTLTGALTVEKQTTLKDAVTLIAGDDEHEVFRVRNRHGPVLKMTGSGDLAMSGTLTIKGGATIENSLTLLAGTGSSDVLSVRSGSATTLKISKDGDLWMRGALTVESGAVIEQSMTIVTGSGAHDAFQIRSPRTSILHINDRGDLAMSGTLVVQSGALIKQNLTIDAGAQTETGDVLKILSASGNVFRVQGNGDVYAKGAFHSGGADYAEWFRVRVQSSEFNGSEKNLQPGELVCVDVTAPNSVKKCENAADPNVMGIVSSNPSIVGNESTIGPLPAEAMQRLGNVLVGLLGQIPAKVTDENGPVRPGDSLTSASIPGYARRANAGEPTVGVALEGFGTTDSGTGSQLAIRHSQFGVIKVLIARSNKSLTTEAVEQRVRENVAALKIDDEIALSMQKGLASLNLTGAVLQATKTMQETEMQKLQDAVRALQAEVKALSGAISSNPNPSSGGGGGLPSSLGGRAGDGGNVTLSGSLHAAGGIDADSLTSENTLTVSKDARIGGDLYLEGMLKVGSLFVPGGMRIDGGTTVGGLLKADQLLAGSGSQVNGTLKVRGRLELASGSILALGDRSQVILGSGSMLTAQDMLVRGALQVLGPVTIQGLAIFLGDVSVHGQLTVSNRQAGYATVGTGATAVSVSFGSGVMMHQPIVTASPDTPVLYAVTKATGTGFMITLAEPAKTAITFSWLSLGVDGPVTQTGATSNSSTILRTNETTRQRDNEPTGYPLQTVTTQTSSSSSSHEATASGSWASSSSSSISSVSSSSSVSATGTGSSSTSSPTSPNSSSMNSSSSAASSEVSSANSTASNDAGIPSDPLQILSDGGSSSSQ